MNKNYKSGFTLIELLVVIAIIGILASVVLASLNSARNKGADAALKANLSNVRAQSEIFYDSNASSYAGGTGIVSATTACVTTQATNSGANYGLMGDASFFRGVSGADTQGGLCGYFNTATGWGVIVQLKSDPLKAFCVDSFGNGKEVADAAAYTTTTLYADLSPTTGCGV